MARHVLIVDDEPDVARYLATVLEAHGYKTRIANSVDDGIKALQSTPPDLVCLDIMMPEELGVSLYLHMRENAALSAIPVVIVSGAAPDGNFDFRSYVPDDAIPEPNAFIEKPIVIPEFLETVGRLSEGAAK